MKLMIASDLHGSAFYTRKLLNAMQRENPDALWLLGDLLYHGPRNDLPRGYAPKRVIAMLNACKDRLLCVRGNCDAEVDQMVLDFPITETAVSRPVDGRTFWLTHGHHPDSVSPSAGDVVLCGHTHVPKKAEQDGVWYLNDGSVSIPKERSPHGYLLYENGVFSWKTLDGKVYDTLTLA